MTRLRRLSWLAVPAILLITSCASNAPQDTLKPEGPVARQVDNLFRPIFWIAAAIFFLVEGLIIYAAIKFRDKPGRTDPKQIHGNSRLEFAWTMAPAVLLLGVAIPTVITLFNLTAKAAPDDLRIKVVAHQWWWEYRYPDTKPEVITANEMVIPTNRQVVLELESQDVIHSFWVPKLAGKQDVVPERTNTLEFIADSEGEYYGQCAEFCSISHANMRLRVIAKSPADYAAWVRNQQAPARKGSCDTGPDGPVLHGCRPAEGPSEGRRLFLSNACISCHAVAGLEGAAGLAGPNLTHFASRGTFGAAMFDNTDDPKDLEDLFLWVKHARDQKPGVLMPNFDRALEPGDPGNVPGYRQLTDPEIRQIVAFLRSLK